MSRTYYTNDYFLRFAPDKRQNTAPKTPKVTDQRIPEGYEIYAYNEVYNPAHEPGLLFYRGAGTNPDTQNVPVYYAGTPAGLTRAITFCQNQKFHDDERKK